MSNNKEDDFPQGFIIESKNFPAFKKARSIIEQAMAESEIPLSETVAAASESEQETGSVEPSETEQTEKGKNEPEEEEHIPALFGNVCLDKYKPKSDIPDEMPTLLEFLNQPIEESPLPVPSLFCGIGKDYFPSDEVLKLAEQAELEEKQALNTKLQGDGTAAQEEASEDEQADQTQKDGETYEVEDLFDMIKDISYQTREDMKRRAHEARKKKAAMYDPYNTAFNTAEPKINMDNVGELPIKEKYDLAPLPEETVEERRRQRVEQERQEGRKGHFHRRSAKPR